MHVPYGDEYGGGDRYEISQRGYSHGEKNIASGLGRRLYGGRRLPLLLLLMAAVIAAVDVPKAAITPLAVVASAVGAFVGGIVAAKIAKEKGLLFGAACGLILFVLVLVAGFAVLKEVRGSFAVAKLFILIGCGAIGGILGVNSRKH